MKKLVLLLLLSATPAMSDTLDEFVTGCVNGDQEACLAGTRKSQRLYKHDLMMLFIRKGCALGNNISCSDLGIFKLMGRHIDLDLEGGAELVQNGCEGGYYRACGNLGWMYFTATGVPRNYAKAAKYYGVGCDGGSAAACENLAKMYEAGDGVRRDPARAKQLFDRACDLGYC
jgi:hypothetical protein